MKFKKNESLTNLLSLKIADASGDIFVPDVIDDILMFTNKYKKFHVLSGGTNVVVGKSKHPLLYMGTPLGNSETRGVEGQEEFVIVQMPAGISNGAFLNYCIENGFSGLEFLAGIPGTIGGAVHGNAAPKGFSWENNAVAILVASEGQMSRFEPEFEYRNLVNKPEKPFVIVAIEILLKKSTKEQVRMAMLSFLKKRIKIKRPSAGSLFRNPDGNLSAGALLDQAGMKGHRVGDAGLSEQHANIVVNYGDATAQDFHELRHLLHKTIEQQHAISLEPEIVFWESV